MKIILGNLIEVKGPAVIAHGVNCQNAMGSGVAKALFEKWPEVKTEYHKFAMKTLGNVQFVLVGKNLYVANCFTQEFYGRDKRRYADPEAINGTLSSVASFVKRSPFIPNEIHMPEIGCGLGGLDFEKDVKPTIDRLEEQTGVIFLIHRI